MKNRIREKTMINTKHGKIIRLEDTLFGGFEYIVQHPNKDCVKRTNNFDEAMSALKELRQELKVW